MPNPPSSNGATASDVSSAPSANASDLAGQVYSEAKGVAKDLASSARQAAEDQFENVKQQAAGKIGEVASAIRAAGDSIGAEPSAAAEVVDDVAARLDSVSRYVETKRLSQLIADVESFVRREPLLTLGGAFLLGIIGARFMKSSAPTRAGRPAKRDGAATSQNPGSAYARSGAP